MKTLSDYFIFIFIMCFSFVVIITHDFVTRENKRRLPSSQENISNQCISQQNCPFLNIGHRGAPYDAPENTIESFEKALELGANALEIDIVVTKDKKVMIFHDETPNNLISIIRQSGMEGLPFVPFVPDLNNPYRRAVSELTYQEFIQHYGLAHSNGAIADIFAQGSRINVKLPTLEEFFQWSLNKSTLKAVVLDVKVTHEKAELLDEIYLLLDQWSDQLPYSLIFSTPDKSLFYKSHASPIKRTIKRMWGNAIDFEEEGSLSMAKKGTVSSLLMGKTILRSWNGFWQELISLLEWRTNQTQYSPYPIIAWTIDQQERMYQLIGTELDGLITNRPRELARIIDRFFDDHKRLAHFFIKCAHDNHSNRRWSFCADGNLIKPLWPMGEREFSEWAKSRSNDNIEIKKLLGMGFGNRKRIEFHGEVDESGNSWMWYRPEKGGRVVMKKAQEEYSRPMMPVVLDFKQTHCNDGFLNYDCEYKMFVSYLDPQTGRWVELINNGNNFESSFYYMTHIPVDVTSVRVKIFETDDNKIQNNSFSLTYFPIRPISNSLIKANDNTFKGNLTFYSYQGQFPDEENETHQQFSIQYNQVECYDGIVNSDCEYRMSISYSYNGIQFLPLENSLYNFESNGSFHTSVPKGVKQMKIKIQETDDQQISSQLAVAEVVMDFVGGERATIQSLDRRTFKGELLIIKYHAHE